MQVSKDFITGNKSIIFVFAYCNTTDHCELAICVKNNNIKHYKNTLFYQYKTHS